MEYPSTENLYARSEETHKLLPGVFKRSDFAQIGDWMVTEKIDGMNARVIYSRADDSVEVRGRSDKAVLPKGYAEEALIPDDGQLFGAALDAIDSAGRAAQMVIYGEAYGPGIQSGGDYAPRKSFAAFDVVTFLDPEDGYPRPPLWRTWADVETVCRVVGLDTVPLLFEQAALPSIYEYVRADPRSVLGERYAEGVVARTDPYLFDFRGDRVLFKLKSKDLP